MQPSEPTLRTPIDRSIVSLGMKASGKLSVAVITLSVSVSVFFSIPGCSKKSNIAPSPQSDEFMLTNGQRRGVVTTSDGWQYEILAPGGDTQIKADQKISGEVTKLNKDGKPVFDGSGGVFLRTPDSYGANPIRKALTMVGEEGVVRIFLPPKIKSGVYARRDDEGDGGSVLIWEARVGKIFTDEEKRSVLKAMWHPSAGALIFDQCGEGKPDMLLPQGCESRVAAFGERFLLPACRPLERSNMVDIALVGSQMRNPEWTMPAMGRWEWLGACSGILVMDSIPHGRSPVVSEYIYGTNTGGQNWKNSYEAISFLDSDGDGWLTGGEMDEVAVWTDRNTDGAVDDGEVSPARDNLQKINVRPTAFSRLDWHIDNEGVVFSDGRTASSWCWATRGGE